MQENTIIFVFLALIPALFFLVPRLRAGKGIWAVACKTVPSGCLVIFFIPVLAVAAVKFGGDFWGAENFSHRVLRSLGFQLGALLGGLAVGIWLIVFWAGKLLAKNGGTNYRPVWLPFLILFILLGAVVMVFPIGYDVFRYSRDMGNFRGEWRACEIWRGNGTRLLFEECPIHPFLAEYDYRIKFNKNGKISYRPLLTNTGGRTHFNIYRLKDGRFLFSDKDCDYIVDPVKAEVLYVFRCKDQWYSAPWPKEKIDSIGRTDGYDARPTVFLGNRKFSASPAGGELEGKVYYGAVTGSFYSAGEKPEQSIDKGMMKQK